MSSQWDDPAEMFARAETARIQGDRELAYQMYARASELNPQDTQAWQGRAETATSADEALVSYAYASALDSENKPLTRTLDAAVAQRIQEANKSDVPLLVALGQELAEVGLTERARPLLERASELDTSSTDALVWLAGIASDDQSQLDYLNRALATNPRDPRARAGLLSVKLPLPPTVSPPASRTERLAALESESATMERLRKLRANVPPAESNRALEPSIENFRNATPGGETRMRNLFILLLVVVTLLAIAGFVFLQLQ